jgi:hypothetical protein
MSDRGEHFAPGGHEDKETVATSDEGSTGASPSSPTSLAYRCLFYRVN